VYKLFLAAAIGVAFVATPAVSDAPARTTFTFPVALDGTSSAAEALPVVALLSGMVLVALSNRRRNLQKVLC
jgi:hypothetical protein